MRPPSRTLGLTAILLAAILLAALVAGACRTEEPELVAAEYLRATDTGNADRAIALLDLEEIVDRVEDEIVLVNTEGDPRRFLRDSVETVLWGLFQEMQRQEGRDYEPQPAERDGERATVRVRIRSPEGEERVRAVHLRRTRAGWKVSGPSIDDLVTYVIQRLEERY